jgi:hypothetical protein
MDGGFLTETVQMIGGACPPDLSSHQWVLRQSSGRDKTDFVVNGWPPNQTWQFSIASNKMTEMRNA